MKKVCEIDAAKVYHKTGEMPWDFNARKCRLNSEWIKQTFSPAQIDFLERHSYTVRPHPKHNPTVEVYINEQGISDKEWTLIRLLF